MDIIIRAIIAIFKEIFEQDAKRRRPKPASKRPKNLEEILEQLEKGQKPQTQPRPRSQAQPKPVEWKVHEVFEAVEPPPIYQPVPKIPEVQKVQPTATKSTRKLLPGKNDLQNLIWAQTILGPCRAKEPFRFKI